MTHTQAGQVCNAVFVLGGQLAFASNYGGSVQTATVGAPEEACGKPTRSTYRTRKTCLLTFRVASTGVGLATRGSVYSGCACLLYPLYAIKKTKLRFGWVLISCLALLCQEKEKGKGEKRADATS